MCDWCWGMAYLYGKVPPLQKIERGERERESHSLQLKTDGFYSHYWTWISLTSRRLSIWSRRKARLIFAMYKLVWFFLISTSQCTFDLRGLFFYGPSPKTELKNTCLLPHAHGETWRLHSVFLRRPRRGWQQQGQLDFSSFFMAKHECKVQRCSKLKENKKWNSPWHVWVGEWDPGCRSGK